MKYIAYGSNMSINQMKLRCPSAKLICTGRIVGARLEFYSHATVECSRGRGDYVPVAVWDISDEDEMRLDRYEGVPTYYIKQKWPVKMDDGSEIRGLIYLMTHKRPFPPEVGYYLGICQAYHDLNISHEIKPMLEPALRRSFRTGHKAVR